jgi:hypothetical protein
MQCRKDMHHAVTPCATVNRFTLDGSVPSVRFGWFRKSAPVILALVPERDTQTESGFGAFVMLSPLDRINRRLSVLIWREGANFALASGLLFMAMMLC